MDFTVPASWLQDAVVSHIVSQVLEQVTPEAEGNPVSVVPGKVREDGSLQIVWSWKPAGATKLGDVRKGVVHFTPEEAVLSYADSLRPPRRKRAPAA